jgi:hypothetical protein
MILSTALGDSWPLKSGRDYIDPLDHGYVCRLEGK